MYLTDTKLHQESYLKIGYSDDPDELLRKFVKDISDLHNTHIMRLQAHRDLPPLTPEEKFRYNAADVCDKCDRKFTKDLYKVRHHDHTTGKFVGACCFQCNLRGGKKH